MMDGSSRAEEKLPVGATHAGTFRVTVCCTAWRQNGL